MIQLAIPYFGTLLCLMFMCTIHHSANIAMKETQYVEEHGHRPNYSKLSIAFMAKFLLFGILVYSILIAIS